MAAKMLLRGALTTASCLTRFHNRSGGAPGLEARRMVAACSNSHDSHISHISHISHQSSVISQINCNRQTAAFCRCELIHTLLKASYRINKQHAVAGNAFNAVCAAI